MKQLVPFILMLFGTFLFAVVLNLALFIARPEVYGPGLNALGQSGDSTKVPGADSLRLAKANSLRQADSLAALPPKQSLEIARLYADTLNEMRRQLALEQARAQEASKHASTGVPSADSARQKQKKDFAKMIEAMSAEDAARILQKMDDADVRTVLMAVKKRQAGKILGALEPSRAARMMN
jgi:flagellar motility protein MotE (MotC chaperone)